MAKTRRSVCADCGISIEVPVYAGRPPQRCGSCFDARRLFLDVLSGRLAASQAVAYARRRGALADPKTLACSDCARPARCYDHRDYGKPLDVAPVCSPCNIKRSHAKPLNPLIVSAVLLAHFGSAGA